MTTEKRCYTELSKLKTYKERFEYLCLAGKVGADTFGFDRYLNQIFYSSPEWKRIRRDVIIRDSACDMGLKGYELKSNLYIHHMNPITVEDVLKRESWILDPEYLITVSFDTHNAIHYGTKDWVEINTIVERSQNDTCPWRK